MHRREMLALAGAVAGGTAAAWVVDRRQEDLEHLLAAEADADEENEASADGEDSDEDEILDPRSGLAQVIWSVDTDQRRAAVTFDDGPDPEFTPRILEILATYGINATFMAMGYNAEEHRDLLLQIKEAGHEIGHHSWRHLNLAHIDKPAETRREVEGGMHSVAQACGLEMRYFRPPRGRLNEGALRLAAQHNQDILLWSVTRGPLDERSPRRIADHIVGDVGQGDIILLHDGIGRGTFKRGSPEAEELISRRSTEVEALPEVLDRIHAQGIQLGTVSELVAARNPGGLRP